MPAKISAILPHSPAAKKRIRPGEALLAINGRAVEDLLDYRFFAAEEKLRLRLQKPNGRKHSIRLRKEQYADLGLEFEQALLDEQRSCKNHCVFCFVDQLPPGLRESLYFKDDDARLSFLFGNYITLTNLSQREVERILAMHLSPVNVSVHTMNPALRVKMMRNPRAGESLALLERFALAGLELNAQLVLCPGWNDGDELRLSLERLLALPGGMLRSVAAVPVGLTKHREGLCALRGFTKDEAAAVIDCFEALRCCAPPEVSLCASDEFFLLAQREIPETEYYGEFRQLENGVGMWALLRGEMRTVLADEALLEGLRRRFPPQGERCVTLVTGKAAEALLRSFVDEWQKLWYNLKISLRGIENHFFGEAITVAGLLTGADIAAQLAGLPLGEEVLLPAACLRHEGDLTLDGMTPAALSEALGVPVRLVENSALPLLLAALGIEDNGEIT